MMSVSQAAILAKLFHHGQVDKAGQPYFSHVSRVADRVVSDEARQVAFLHDVLEDTSVTANDLLGLGFSPRVVRAVETLTRRGKLESYAQFIERIVASGDVLAIEVKTADVQDHLQDASAISESHAKRYRAALAALTK